MRLQFFFFLSLATVQAAVPYATVILSRHCVRTPETDWYCMGNYSGNPQYWASDPWPEFPAPPMICTPRGLEIIKGQGKHYGPTLPKPINFIADNVTRDVQTAEAYAAGLGIAASVQVNGALFNPTQYGVCAALSNEEADAAIAEWMESHPWAGVLPGLVAEVQAVLGGPPLPLPPVISGGLLTGGSCAGSEASEAFLLELGSGVEVAWGRSTPSQLKRWLQLQVYNMWLENCGAIGANQHSNLLWGIRNQLAAYSAGSPGTTFFVGHDSDLAGLGNMLGLSWTQPGYPADTTNPGSALRFDLYRDGSEWSVGLTHVGTEFYTSEGRLTVTPVKAAWGSQPVPWATFDQAVQAALDWACVQH